MVSKIIRAICRQNNFGLGASRFCGAVGWGLLVQRNGPLLRQRAVSLLKRGIDCIVVTCYSCLIPYFAFAFWALRPYSLHRPLF